MENSYSLDGLLEFLDYLGRKGLMNKNTVVSRKAACNKVLSILDEVERFDLRRIDLDSVAERFANLQGSGYAPKSLRVYQSRVKSSMDDFFRYRENPANFSIGAKPRKRLPEHRKSPEQLPERNHTVAQAPTPKPHVSIDTINVPIAISADHIIQINGLPLTLSKSAAQRIANVILAMAIEEE